jgi:AcrR family transcriptional regulator
MTKTEQAAETGAGLRKLRRDAAINRDRVLAAAAIAVRREGVGVPLATIAADAGVGTGTLYRHYPSREALLTALTHRSYRLVLDAARRAAEIDGSAIEALRHFLHQTVEHGADLVLPLHGGPVLVDEGTITLRTAVHDTLEQVVRRGQHDGTVRPDITVVDIIIFGALLAEPLPHAPDWRLSALRQAGIYLDGLVATTRAPLPGPGPTRAQFGTAPDGTARTNDPGERHVE